MLDVLYEEPGNNGPATYVVLIAVPEYAAVFDQEPLTSASASYDHLATFWRNAAERRPGCATFAPTPPLRAVYGKKLTPGAAASARVLLGDLHAVLTRLAPCDNLIVQWIGHGSFIERHSDHVLYLPELQSPDDMEVLEAYTLTRFSDWVGAVCRARTQLLLFDCCSTPLASERHAPEPYPHRVAQAERGPKQSIIVGSGFSRATRGRDGEPSVFTNAIVKTLTRYGADGSGNLTTGRRLVTVLAALAKSDWIVRQFPDFPRLVLRPGTIDWTQEFVQEVQPHCRHFAAQTDLKLGVVEGARVHCCLAYRNRKRVARPRLEVDPPLPLVAYHYADSEDPATAIWAWIGEVEAGQSISARLYDDAGNPLGSIHTSAVEAPVLHAWF